MGEFITANGLMALGTALAGIILFCLAPCLPSLFPPALTRLVGFWAFCAALVALWVLTESWKLPGGVGACGLAAMCVIHVVQTRRSPAPSQLEDSSKPER